MTDEPEDDFPTYEFGEFKIVDASGQGLPKEVIDMFVDAMVREGKLIRNSDGSLEKGPTATDVDQIIGIDFTADADGNVVESTTLDVDDIPAEFKPQ